MGRYDRKEPDSHPSLDDLAEITRKRRVPKHSPIENRKKNLIAYMRDCILIEDWHGVSDAANDLREVAVEYRLTVGVNHWLMPGKDN